MTKETFERLTAALLAARRLMGAAEDALEMASDALHRGERHVALRDMREGGQKCTDGMMVLQSVIMNVTDVLEKEAKQAREEEAAA